MIESSAGTCALRLSPDEDYAAELVVRLDTAGGGARWRTYYLRRDDLVALLAQGRDVLGELSPLAADELSIVERLGCRAKEAQVAAAMQRAGGRIVTREHLTNALWGADPDGGPNDPESTVKVYVSRLRRLHGVEIETVWGVGYRLVRMP